MRKGITPIISIIILLLITVALAGAAWTFLQGFIFPQISKSFLVPDGGSFCSAGRIQVYLVNTGYQSDLTSTDIIVHEINGQDADFSIDFVNDGIPISESGLVIDDSTDANNGGQPWESGTYHTVSIGTTSSIQQLSVFCP